MSQKALTVEKKSGKEEKVNVMMAGPNDVLKLAILAKMTEKRDVPLMEAQIEAPIANFKVKKIDFNVWEVKGKDTPVCEPLDPVLEKCVMKSKALIYVVDSSDDQNRINESKKVLLNLLRVRKMCPVLIFINKTDKTDKSDENFSPNKCGKLHYELNGSIRVLDKSDIRPLKIQLCNSLEINKGYIETGFNWLADEQLKTVQKSEKKKSKEDEEEKVAMPIVMAGLSNAGKSTILSNMINMTKKEQIWIGKEKIKRDCITYKVCVMSGNQDPETIGKKYVKDIKALIFVMEEKNNMEEECNRGLKKLKALLGIKQLENNPLLILYNQDGSKNNYDSKNVSIDQFKERIGEELKDRNGNYYVQACTATTNEGLWLGFKMLEKLLKKQKECKEMTKRKLKKGGVPGSRTPRSTWYVNLNPAYSCSEEAQNKMTKELKKSEDSEDEIKQLPTSSGATLKSDKTKKNKSMKMSEKPKKTEEVEVQLPTSSATTPKSAKLTKEQKN